MKLVLPTETQTDLLGRFSAAGGVVRFVLIECDQPGENALDASTHRRAVGLAMREIQRQCDEYAEEVSAKHEIPKSQVFQVAIDGSAEERLTPRVISWQEFLGTRYDFQRKGLIVHGKGKILNEFFYFSDPARPENITPRKGIDYGVGNGFAYAFSDPPYHMGLSAEERGTLLGQFLRIVMRASSSSFICEWPTDWSNYFDAGKEWWGSFLWSLANPGENRIVVIAASTTD